MIGNRAVNEGPWMELSRALTDSGEAALKAARNKNVDEVLAAGDKIYAACDNCHKKYMDKSVK
jgi:cytochrome c556